MIESPEQIQTTLSQAGETLTFSFGAILGIPGALIYNVSSYESPYDVEKQDINFQIATNDFLANAITSGDTFTYLSGITTYTLEVITHSDDLIGWVNLRCNLIGVSDV